MRVYIWIEVIHTKFPITPGEKLMVFDSDSNLIAEFPGRLLLQQIEHAIGGVALEALLRAKFSRPPQALPSRTEEERQAPPDAGHRAALRGARRSRRRA